MELLVMGGTEFVSEALAKHFISKGYTVDIFTRGLKPVIYEGFRNHIKGDRHSAEKTKEALSDREYDYVFDISAYTKDDVRILLSVLNKNKLKRYVFCSSGGVYVWKDKKMKEDNPKVQDLEYGPYRFNKKDAEDYLFKLYKQEQLPITIFRPSYIYGEKNNAYREAYFFDRITNSLPIPIPHGKGTRAQFIYIEDLIKQFESAMFSEKAIGKAYNSSMDEDITWEYYVETAMKAAGKRAEVKKISTYTCELNPLTYFPFYDDTYLLDNENVEKDGLYVPSVKLREGLEKSYKWYCEANPKLSSKIMVKIDYVLETDFNLIHLNTIILK